MKLKVQSIEHLSNPKKGNKLILFKFFYCFILGFLYYFPSPMAAFSVFSGRILSEVLSIYSVPLSEDTIKTTVLK